MSHVVGVRVGSVGGGLNPSRERPLESFRSDDGVISFFFFPLPVAEHFFVPSLPASASQWVPP